MAVTERVPDDPGMRERARKQELDRKLAELRREHAFDTDGISHTAIRPCLECIDRKAALLSEEPKP